MKHKTKEATPMSGAAKGKIKNDVIFIAVLLLLIAMAALALILFRTAGDTVVVTVDGELWGEYSLSEDQTVEIRNGEGYNLLIIEDGKAYMKQASCPDRICVSHRPTRHSGESIICLPNRVIVEIRTQDKNQPDIVA